MSEILPGGIAPALFIKISILLQKSLTFSTAFFLDKSIAITSTEILCLFCKFIFNSFNLSVLLAVNIKLHPSFAIDSAIALPIPLEAPVISAVLLFKFNSIIIPSKKLFLYIRLLQNKF